MMTNEPNFKKPILTALRGEVQNIPPVWLMRQAGRYLPEYRKTRELAGGFLQMVYDPSVAAEITLQPIRRYGMDGAILFSDILIVPDAFDRNLRFEAGEGPRLEPLKIEDVSKLKDALRLDKFSRIAETVSECRLQLAKEKFDHVTLLGFCGSPWTVACYMIDGKGGDFAVARDWAQNHKETLDELIDILVDASFTYLSMQIQAGAEAVQLFDSWAGLLDKQGFERFVTNPTTKLVKRLKEIHPNIPVIGFPRGAGHKIVDYAAKTGVDCVACDTDVPLELMFEVQKQCCVQGNLDPITLLEGGENLVKQVRDICNRLKHGPFVFNLGHGVIKETDPQNVAAVIETVREKP